MGNFTVETTDKSIRSNGGLIFVGDMLEELNFSKYLKIKGIENSDKEISNSDVLKSYIGLLCEGKTEYAKIEKYRNDAFFKEALGIDNVPSESTLRQRLDGLSEDHKTIHKISDFITLLLKKYSKLTPALETDYIPVDFDVSPFDNSNSKKEGASYTYKKFKGFAPIFVYMGNILYILNNELREGKRHCNCEGTDEFIYQTLKNAREISSEKLLARFDSGNDARDNIIKI